MSTQYKPGDKVILHSFELPMTALVLDVNDYGDGLIFYKVRYGNGNKYTVRSENVIGHFHGLKDAPDCDECFGEGAILCGGEEPHTQWNAACPGCGGTGKAKT